LEIGSEPTLQEWVSTLVDVFRQVRRVLRDDGTVFLNLGDSYAAKSSGGLKAKDLMGQPWRVAFALQADGWWLRQEIIFHKRNPMPETVTDRFTKAHEHVFLLSKSARYHWNFAAMQEPASGGAHARRAKTPDGWDTRTGEGGHGSFHANGREKGTIKAPPEGVGRRQGPPGSPAERKLAEPGSGTKNNDSFDEAMAVMPPTRNPRSVWTMNTVAFKGAHFATFAPELAERCITAGCPPGGVVLDPFGGSGTVGMVADRMHLDAILIDLDERSVAMARERIVVDAKMFAQVSA
jgi:site-specific DNA-methyltransferase (cytosine-N4-specific)